MPIFSFLKIFALIILTAVCGAAIVISWQFFLIAFLMLIFFIIILFWPEKAFYFLIFYIPFQIALNPIEGIDLASVRILIILLFFAWLLFSLSRKKLFIPNAIQTWLILIFLFIVFLSFCYAPEQERALRKTLFLFNIIPLYFISASIIKSKIQINKIISISIFAALLTGIIGLIQFGSQFIIGQEKIANFWAEIISPIFYGESFGAQIISLPSWFVNISGETYLRAFGFFPDPHMFSFYLGLIIPMVLAFLIFGNKKRIFLFIILTILISSILLSFSRGGYLGMIAGVGVVIILLWRQISFNKKIALGLISAIAIIFLLTTS